MTQDQNNLYPVFLKLCNLKLLIVGAGNVGFEKLSFLLKSSPDANISVIAKNFSDQVQNLIADNDRIEIIEKAFTSTDVIGHDIIIAATNNEDVNAEIYAAAKHHNKVVNVADTPHLCDFYMGSIITRGDLKIAISTNGKSPTFSKRFRQLLESILPVESHSLVNNLKLIRDRLEGNFEYKVKELNRITKTLLTYE